MSSAACNHCLPRTAMPAATSKGSWLGRLIASQTAPATDQVRRAVVRGVLQLAAGLLLLFAAAAVLGYVLGRRACA